MSNPLFTLSKMAQEQISKLLVDNNNAIGLKIGLSTKGCAGLSYTMEYVNESDIHGCELVNDYKFPLYIDNKAVMYVIGTEMDFIKEEYGERFVFKNPNQTSECGCGESFHV
jgi:iron-sulfur cluster assembly protein|tara:strand:+ start:103 stop:438 length:336 start_codon:yes stop_codon:yes gene_type:complete